MGLTRRGPFKKSASKNVFQTVDVGTGKGRWILEQAKKFPNRKYAVVDPKYRRGGDLHSTGQRMAKHGIHVHPEGLQSFIEFMLKNNKKTRHINIDMPGQELSIPLFNFPKLFEALPKILMPNGKIYFSTEDLAVRDYIHQFASIYGFKSRELRKFGADDPAKRTPTMRLFHVMDVFRIEVTFGLKKAVPNKQVRIKWPQ